MQEKKSCKRLAFGNEWDVRIHLPIDKFRRFQTVCQH